MKIYKIVYYTREWSAGDLACGESTIVREHFVLVTATTKKRAIAAFKLAQPGVMVCEKSSRKLSEA